jgi:ureidoglycolate lyase
VKEITVKKLSPEGFAKYGTYANMINPVAPKIGAVQSQLGLSSMVSFGVCRVVNRPFVMDVSEYHDSCCEVVMPLDGDIVMHVAPAVPEKEFPFEQAEVFLVPKGTLCCLRPGVWHHGPYAIRTEVVNCLIALPERAYVNDCKFYSFPPDRHMKIVGEGVD